jgi:hypothetical protein
MAARLEIGARGMIAAAIVLGFVLLFSFHFLSQSELDRSLEILLGERLHLEYRVVKEDLDRRADAAGAWWVVVDEASRARLAALADPDLARYGEHSHLVSELAEHRRAILERFDAQAEPEAYEVLGGELALGGGSICSDHACNVVLLVEHGGRNVFVHIWKII